MNNIRSGKIFHGLKEPLENTIMKEQIEDVEGIGESERHEKFCSKMKCEECPLCYCNPWTCF